MPVVLRRSTDIDPNIEFDQWLSTGSRPDLADERHVGNLPELLEQAYEASMGTWWVLARRLSETSPGICAHTFSCAPNGSETGLMLAWTRLVDARAQDNLKTLVICDDPWLFRHLARRENVHGGTAPPIAWRTALLAFRGLLSRCWRVACLAAISLLFRKSRGEVQTGTPILISYGHPASDWTGIDAYFGDLMSKIAHLQRMIHTDADLATTRRLTAGASTQSLHGWGNPIEALKLISRRWRPANIPESDENIWLIRRAASLEGSNAQAVMSAWQTHCQSKFLNHVRPTAVIWPWENHCWERELARSARQLNIRAVGYQHSVVGRHAANHAPASCPDGPGCLPDLILCNGLTGRTQLSRWRIPAGRLAIGGALRFQEMATIEYDADSPIFVALPLHPAVAGEMIEVIGGLRGSGLRFILKVHPMMSMNITETADMKRTDQSLLAHRRLRGVLFAASTVGLEAMLCRLPTYRFVPSSSIAIDILTPPAAAIPVDRNTLQKALLAQPHMPDLKMESFFSPVDLGVWQRAMEPDHVHREGS